jgi:hypothetical protein
MRLPDENEWLAHCTECFEFREFDLVYQRDPDERREFVEVVCKTCKLTLFTFKPREVPPKSSTNFVRLKKPGESPRLRRTK